jgi:hypothetical protein
MGFNSRDRNHDHWIRTRAREVKRLEQEGGALHLIVTGAKTFNDKSFVTVVLDRIHRERGISLLVYCSTVRSTYYADRWAQSRGTAVRYVQRADIFQQPAHGVVAFDGPDEFVARGRDAGLIVWRIRPKPVLVAKAPPPALAPLPFQGEGQSEEWKTGKADRRAGCGRKDRWRDAPAEACSHDRIDAPYVEAFAAP